MNVLHAVFLAFFHSFARAVCGTDIARVYASYIEGRENLTAFGSLVLAGLEPFDILLVRYLCGFVAEALVFVLGDIFRKVKLSALVVHDIPYNILGAFIRHI